MITREVLRYLIAGGANTALTYLLFLALLPWIDYRLAYTLAFVGGIGLSFMLLRHAVFARPGKPFSLVWVALSQGLQLGLGLAIVQAWVVWMKGPTWLAPMVAALLCVPLMFVVQRWIFTPNDTH